MPRKKTLEEMVAGFHAVHGDRYGYELLVYKGSATKVSVVCKIHGPFHVTPNHHSKGVGCRQCFFDSQKITKAAFVERSQRHFFDRYDYSLFTRLPKFGQKVFIRCIEHDEVFSQEPRNHMRGHIGCPQCISLKLASVARGTDSVLTLEELKSDFVSRSHEVHGQTYSYSKFNFVNFATKGTVFCSVHGDFKQTPSNHLLGHKCPSCSRDQAKEQTFKRECEDRGVDYWRALKRRQAGLSEEKVFEKGHVRHSRETTPLIVHGIRYPNLKEAQRDLNPPASTQTIARWLDEGISTEEAFSRVPNPGYAKGLIYVVTHKESGKQYVGLTVQSLARRWQSHCDQALAAVIKHDNSLHASIREFGDSAFLVEEIDYGTTKSDLETKERQWIRNLDTLVPHGFNISPGGTSGGSSLKPVTVDGQNFLSTAAATQYVATTRNITLSAAAKRLSVGRIDVRPRAAVGKSVVKTPAYKAWDRIVHSALNPKSKDYIAGLDVYERWRDSTCFIEDVGQPLTKGMAFTRIDKERGFYPDNCRWLTKSAAGKLNAAHMKRKGQLVGRKGKSAQ